jgi:glycosyltransferase involved in cell wall biosynthesis
MVSIIIPLYNRIALFPETVESVLKQTYTDWEAIIIDDHSTDGSYEYALQLSANDRRIKVLKNREGKKGASSARNTGLLYATGQYIIFLDSDDLLASHCLKQRVEVMKSEDKLDFAVFQQATFLNGSPNQIKIFNKYATKKGDDFLKMFLRNENPWTVTCPIWKKEVLFNLNGFDEDLIYMEDPDLHSRAILNDNKFNVYQNLPVDSFYRIGNMDSSKEDVFYKNSIIYRIHFFKKMVLLLLSSKKGFRDKHFTSIKEGYISLLKHFILARMQLYSSEFFEIAWWLRSKEIIGEFKYLKILLVGRVFLSESRLIKTLRIRGLVFKMI